jgi:hypothetical protein
MKFSIMCGDVLVEQWKLYKRINFENLTDWFV